MAKGRKTGGRLKGSGKPAIERLLARIAYEPNSGCWLWEGNVNPKGYGQIGVGADSMVATHRVAYEHFKGPIPEGLQVLHSCDVPCCCNPQHLSVGTHQDNIDDKMRKGRHKAGRHTKSRGAANGNSILKEDAVRHIRSRELAGVEYARLYGVSKSTVSAIQVGRIWQHLSP